MSIGIGAINPGNIGNPATGFAMNLRTRVDSNTASNTQNTGNPSNPSAIGGSNTGDLSLARIMFEMTDAANRDGGKVPITGSPQYSRIGRAIITGTVTSGGIMDISI